MTLQVVAGVWRRDDRYFVCRRPLEKRHGGLWEFPGGKVEPGETLFSAIKRELAEELNLNVTHIGEVEFSVVDEGSSFVINFATVEVTGRPSPIEHIAVDWLTLQELLNLSLAPSDRQFVDHLAQVKTVANS